MQVLIVEDDIRLAQAVGKILEENGYQVDMVHDGQAGYDYAESDIYDVVILDVMLPKMDGFEVVRNLRRANVDTPVLLLTARGQVPDKIEALISTSCGCGSLSVELAEKALKLTKELSDKLKG